MNQQEKLAILRLIRTNNIGPVTLTMLLRRYKTGEAVLECLPDISKNSRISLNIYTKPKPRMKLPMWKKSADR